ncbi:MAG TPA: hypothetical protein PKL84_17225, partial [Candidatus Hydrogenedentes bacterium]|nr:hypothetical protein [Candidatus Hydrogenedentota bacterium]
FRNLRVYTAYEYLEHRFSLRVRLLASALFILWRVTWMAVTLYVPAMVLHVASDGAVPIAAAVIVLGAAATVYTTFGGLRAVIWTDIAQFIVMFSGVGVALYTVTAHVPGGVAGVIETAASAGKTAIAASVPGWDGATFGEKFKLYLYTDFTVLAIIVSFTLDKFGNYCVDQTMIQRYLSARSIETARRGFLLNCVTFASYFTLMICVGLALFAFRAHTPLPEGLKADAVFPHFIANYMPVGAAGLMLSAIMAAAMSSMDSGVNACIGAITNDFYYRAWRGEHNMESAANDAEAVRARVRLARYSCVGLGALVIACGSVVGSLGTVFELALKVVNCFLGELFALFLLGLFTRRAGARGVFWGGVIGGVITALVVLARNLAAWSLAWNGGQSSALSRFFAALDIGFLWTSAVGLIATLVIGYGLSLILDRGREQPRWTYRDIGLGEPEA